MPFPLLDLPVELRLRIYDYMLNPANARTGAPTKTRINWIYGSALSESCEIFRSGKSHEIPSTAQRTTCSCQQSGSPWIPGLPSQLSPGILATSSFVHNEALPRLYQQRLWEVVNFRTFGTQHEACLERWWIMDCFLARLGADARQYVTAIRVAMLVSPYYVYGCKDAFASIQARLPRLRSVEVEPILAGAVRGPRFAEFSVETAPGKLSSLVWPVMEFDCEVRLTSTVNHLTRGSERERQASFCAAQQSKVDDMKEKRRRRAQLHSSRTLIEIEDLDIGVLWSS